MRCQERKERKRIETEQMEREREIQRLIGKDRISWVGDSLPFINFLFWKMQLAVENTNFVCGIVY